MKCSRLVFTVVAVLSQACGFSLSDLPVGTSHGSGDGGALGTPDGGALSASDGGVASALVRASCPGTAFFGLHAPCGGNVVWRGWGVCMYMDLHLVGTMAT